MVTGMGKRVELVWPEGLVEAVDRAADGRPRSVWLRQVVEKALGDAYRPVSGGRKEHLAGAAQVDNAPASSRPPVTAHASGHSPADPDATRLPAPGRPVRGERESAVDYGIRVKDWQRRQRV